MKKISRLKSKASVSAVSVYNALPGNSSNSYEAAMTVEALKVLKSADNRLVSEMIREAVDYEQRKY